ncbi:hypothetical protein FS837_000347 [Tulasnella sp. UAMH 9824]|nr:hypothetical protein FS837_000347 [Tulasnella sp. UAMH 9824]
MGFFSSSEDEQTWQTAHNEVNNAGHKAELSHELIAGAAAYEAAKAWEKHQEDNGEKPSHAKAKEIFAGIGGAFIDRIVETKGLDYIDKEKAKRQAEKIAEEHASLAGAAVDRLIMIEVKSINNVDKKRPRGKEQLEEQLANEY